jgi:uncharacterized protein (TIGR02466 family)
VAATQAGDPVAASLLDFDAVLQVAPFDVDGLDRVALAAELLAHPSLRDDRGSKTTRDGGQTGNLSDATTPQLARFVQALRDELGKRIGTAGARFAASGHPLAGTAPARWQLNLWATVLRRQGHQAAHLHPAGWLSGVYYVAVPGVAAEREDGWIEFGLPPPELADATGLPRRRVQPRAGDLATFPSYLYHRTVPHADGEPRISLAFDVVPVV